MTKNQKNQNLKNQLFSEVDNAENELVRRIEECSTVVNHLAGCQAWAIIKKDLELNRKFVDDNWQDITEETKLKEARVLKLAYNHLINLVDKYKEDLNDFEESLKRLRNQDKEIIRDYDTE